VFEDLYIKDLRLFSNRKKEDLIIVDNLIYSFALDLQNGIPIKSYYEGKEDYELIFIAEQLEELKSFMDCTAYLEAKFSLSKFYNYI
jgi:CTD small phosphatase-like protein 2